MYRCWVRGTPRRRGSEKGVGTVWEPGSTSRRLLHASIALIAASAVLLGFAGASAAKSAKPVISGLAASPAAVASAGTTTVSATVTGAVQCTLSATKPVQGLPVTVPCESGSVSQAIEMPVNSGRKSVRYTLTVTATGAGGSAKAKTTVVLLDKSESPGAGRGLAAGSEFTCAVLATGHVACWGLNGNGQLGSGNQTSTDVPVEVQAIDDATQVSAGHGHTCALLSTGHIECWGLNGNGQLGDGSETSSDYPVEVHGITDATEVSAGWDSTCALLATGNVECWGMGEGRLGDGSEASSDTPVEAVGVTDATELTAGWDHTCARLSTGRILCWGQNTKGQLGTGSSSSFAYDSPVEVQGITDAAAVSAGGEAADDPYTCALLSTGHVECWGANKEGQLGDGTTSEHDRSDRSARDIRSDRTGHALRTHLRAAVERSHRLLGSERIRSARHRRPRFLRCAGHGAEHRRRRLGGSGPQAHVRAALDRTRRVLGRRRQRRARRRQDDEVRDAARRSQRHLAGPPRPAKHVKTGAFCHVKAANVRRCELPRTEKPSPRRLGPLTLSIAPQPTKKRVVPISPSRIGDRGRSHRLVDRHRGALDPAGYVQSRQDPLARQLARTHAPSRRSRRSSAAQISLTAVPLTPSLSSTVSTSRPSRRQSGRRDRCRTPDGR